jgi:hypothetical protein
LVVDAKDLGSGVIRDSKVAYDDEATIKERRWIEEKF